MAEDRDLQAAGCLTDLRFRALFSYTPRTLITDLPALSLSVGFLPGSKVSPFANDARQIEPEGRSL